MKPIDNGLHRLFLNLKRLDGRNIAAGALALASLNVAAQTSPAHDPRFARFMQSTVGNNQTVTFSGTGTAVASPSPIGSVSAGAWGIERDTAGAVNLRSTGNVPVPGKNFNVPVSAKVNLSARAIGTGLWRGAVAVSAVGTAWSVGNELFDIWSDLGYTPLPDGTINTGDLTKCQNSSGCTEYRYNQNVTPVGGGQWALDRATACASIPHFDDPGSFTCGSGGNGSRVSVWRFQTSDNTCRRWIVNANGCESNFQNSSAFETRQVPKDPTGALVPLTEAQFLDQVASRSNWPTSSAIALGDALQYPAAQTALADAVQAQPAANTTVRLAPIPGTEVSTATVGAPQVQTRTYTNAANEPMTETKTTTTTAAALGNQITYTTTTTTNTVNNTTGATTSETTTTQQAPTDAAPMTEAECAREENAGKLGCIDVGEVPGDEVPRDTETITFTPQNLFGSGTCPASPTWTDSLGTHSLEMGPICEMTTDIIRPVVLAMAALAAFFIVLPFARGNE
jgi:hypothetical protein